MNRRHFLQQVALVCAGLGMGCQRQPDSLRVGLDSWVGYQTLYLAKTFGWLPDTTRPVTTESLTDSQQALREGRVDAAALTLDGALNLMTEGVPIQVVMVFNVSTGADQLLARDDRQQLSQLAGARIGMENTALAHMMLHHALQAASLPAQAITPVYLPNQQLPHAWQTQAVDAVITYGAPARHIRQQGGHSLFTSRHMPQLIIDVLAVRHDRMNACDLCLKQLVQAHFRALNHLQTHRQDAIYRMAHQLNTPVEQIQQDLAGITLPSLEYNHQLLTTPSPLYLSLQQIQPFLPDLPPNLFLAPEQILFTQAYLPRELTP